MRLTEQIHNWDSIKWELLYSNLFPVNNFIRSELVPRTKEEEDFDRIKSRNNSGKVNWNCNWISLIFLPCLIILCTLILMYWSIPIGMDEKMKGNKCPFYWFNKKISLIGIDIVFPPTTFTISFSRKQEIDLIFYFIDQTQRGQITSFYLVKLSHLNSLKIWDKMRWEL